jgi:putative SOS response-associated peptidase YedK
VRNTGSERELVLMRWGMPPRRAAGDQYPQHLLTALARLAEARKPLHNNFRARPLKSLSPSFAPPCIFIRLFPATSETFAELFSLSSVLSSRASIPERSI